MTWTLSWLTRSTPQPCLEHHQAAPDTGSGEGKPERESCKKGKHWGESADIRGGPLGARTAPWAGLLEGTTAGQRHCTKGCWGLGTMQVASWYHCCLYRATEQIQMEEWAWRYCSCFSTPRKKKDELLLGIFFFLENVYSGSAHSTRLVMAHCHICNVIIGAHPRMSNLLRSINVAPSQRGRRKHKRHVGIKCVHE